MLTILRKTTFLLFSTSLAKFLPLLIGYFITSQGGSSSYAVFVSFLLFSGVATNFSALGCAPQALSIDNKSSKSLSFFSNLFFVGCLSVFLVSAVAFLLVKVELVEVHDYFLEVIYFSVIYSFGMFLIYIATSRLNGFNKHDWASVIWLAYSFILLSGSLLWYVLNLEEGFIFIVLACSSLVAGVLASFLVLKSSGESFSKFISHYSFRLIIVVSQKSMQLSIFGFLIVGMFFYLQTALSVRDEAAGVIFSFLYQAFVLIIFIPSIAGNIVIPSIVKGISENTLLYLVYAALAAAICLFFYGVYPYFSNLYDLPDIVNSDEVLLVFCISCVLAATNSYSIQILVAKKEYFYLTLLALLWFVSILVYLFYYDFLLLSVIYALFYAYLVMFLLSLFVIKKKNYLWASHRA